MKFYLAFISILSTSIYSYAVDMNEVKQVANKAKSALEKLKVENINCCDYRHETQCRHILGSETGKGLEVFRYKMIDPDGKTLEGSLIPLELEENLSSYRIKGLLRQGGMGFDYVDRDIRKTSSGPLWIGRQKVEHKIAELVKKPASVAIDWDAQYSPEFNCYLQSALPPEIAPKTSTNDTKYWCEFIGIKEEKFISGKWYCRSAVKCWGIYGLGKSEHEVACEKSNCDTATKCNNDPNAYPDNGQIIVRSDGLPLPADAKKGGAR